MSFKQKPTIVAFDVDGHLLKTEEFAYCAYLSGLRKFFLDNELAQHNIQQYLAPESGGRGWFAAHFMGHSHKEVMDEINTYIAPNDPMNILKFKKEFLPSVDAEIANNVTPDYLFPGVWEMFEDLKRLEDKGVIKLYFISGSAISRLKTSFKNSGLDRFITDFDEQVFSGENYTNKTEVLRKLADGDLLHIMYSGDGYGDAKSCKNVVGNKDVYFIGKSEGAHCVKGHREELISKGVSAITSSSYGLHNLILQRLAKVQRIDNLHCKWAEAYNAMGSWQRIL